MDARKVAFEALLNIKTNTAYSNNALTQAFKAIELTPKDQNLATEIVYGTLTQYRLLHYQLTPYFQGRVKEWIQILLIMTLYQIVYLKKIPNYAAINTAVEIAKARGGTFNGSIVNAILRKVISTDLRSVDEIEEEPERLAIQYSHPTWLVRLWRSQFGLERTLAMLQANNERPKLTLRINLAKTTKEILTQTLTSEGITYKESILCSTALLIDKGNPLQTTAFKKGLFYIQDEASMLPAMALAPTKGAQILDVCAAPGGKSFHLAEMAGESGVVYAHDVYDHKIARIKENIKRLGINNVKVFKCSAFELDHHYAPESFNYILVDAPCSGLGILRRHPEAKLTKKPEDLDEIINIQKDILATSAKYLKLGGRLVYSTCTVNRKENQRQIEAFLKTHQNFELDHEFESRMPAILKNNFEQGMLQLFPQDFETDGFFVASLVKKR